MHTAVRQDILSMPLIVATLQSVSDAEVRTVWWWDRSVETRPTEQR